MQARTRFQQTLVDRHKPFSPGHFCTPDLVFAYRAFQALHETRTQKPLDDFLADFWQEYVYWDNWLKAHPSRFAMAERLYNASQRQPLRQVRVSLGFFRPEDRLYMKQTRAFKETKRLAKARGFGCALVSEPVGNVVRLACVFTNRAVTRGVTCTCL